MKFDDVYEQLNEKYGAVTLPTTPYEGLIVKLSTEANYDEWMVITKVSGDKLTGVTEISGPLSNISFKNDIKRVIGDIKNDFVGIGEKRHKSDVVEFIQKHVKKPKTFTEETD